MAHIRGNFKLLRKTPSFIDLEKIFASGYATEAEVSLRTRVGIVPALLFFSLPITLITSYVILESTPTRGFRYFSYKTQTRN